MKAYFATVIRDGILSARRVIAGDILAESVAYHCRRDTTLWFHAYWRTLQRHRVQSDVARMRLNLHNDVAGWTVREPLENEDQHVLPVDDMIEHLANDCPCGPTTEAVERADGTFGWVLTHHSLDGREAHE